MYTNSEHNIVYVLKCHIPADVVLYNTDVDR